MSERIKLINADEARAKLTTGIERNKRQLAVIQQVVEALKGMEGKGLNKHLANALEKQFPSLKFYVASPHSWYSLDIEGEGFDSVELMLCYKTDPCVVDTKRIMDRNGRYFFDEKRIPQYEEELKTIEARVERYNAAVRELMAAHEGLGTGRHFFTENQPIRAEDENGRIITV